MTTLLQIVDPDDGVTVLFDLNDNAGTNSGDYGPVKTFLLSDPSWRSAQFDFTRQEFTAAAGGVTPFVHPALTDCSINVRIVSTTASYDGLTSAVGRLSRYLSQGCTMLWQPVGAAYPRYIDVEPSQTPYLFDGHNLSMFEAVRLADTPKGITLSLVRQPYLRGAELNPDVNLITNASLMLDRTQADKQPDTWTIDSGTSVTDNGVVDAAEAFSLTLAQSLTRNLQQSTSPASVGNGQTWTFSYYAKVAAGGAALTASAAFQPQTSAPGNNGAEIVGTGVVLTTSWQRLTATGTTPGSSNDRAKCSIRLVTAAGASTQVYLRWAQFEQAGVVSPFRVGAETVSTDPTAYAGRAVPFVNIGDAPAPVKVKVTASTPQSYLFATRSGRGIPGKRAVGTYLNQRKWLGASGMTLGTDASLAADASNGYGAGNNYAAISFASDTSLNAIRLSSSTTTLLDPWVGTMGLWARIQAFDNFAPFSFQVRYSMDSLGQREIVLPAVTIAGAAISSGYWINVYVGNIAPSTTAVEALYLKFYVAHSGSGPVNVNGFFLVPADETTGAAGSITAPGGSNNPVSDGFLCDPSDPSAVRMLNSSGAAEGFGMVRGAPPITSTYPGTNAVAFIPDQYSLAAGYPGSMYDQTIYTAKLRFIYSPLYYV